jgi:DNA-binding HxlR family transcriptional regulator
VARIVKELPEEPGERALKALGGRWKMVVLYHVMEQPRRFSELERLIPDIAQKVLVDQLRELEEYGLVRRIVTAGTPPRVEYVATELGRSARPLMKGLCAWGAEHAKKTKAG